MTINVTFQYYNVLRRAAGVAEQEVCLATGSSLCDALEHLSRTSGATLRNLLFTAEGDMVSYVVVFRNKKLVTHDPFDTELADGDELKLFPAISGG